MYRSVNKKVLELINEYLLCQTDESRNEIKDKIEKISTKSELEYFDFSVAKYFNK